MKPLPRSRVARWALAVALAAAVLSRTTARWQHFGGTASLLALVDLRVVVLRVEAHLATRTVPPCGSHLQATFGVDSPCPFPPPGPFAAGPR
jgi:Ca2+/H+ antiporter